MIVWGYDIRVYFLLFMIYSVLGWTMEVTCKLIQYKRFINRGFLIGPYCPIYGCGGILITVLLNRYMSDPFVLFVMAILLCGTLEYLTSYFMEKAFKARWWDYSQRKFNINGRICVAFSMFWGILAIYLITHFNPKVDKFLEKFSYKQLKKAVIIIMIFLMIDMVITGIGLKVFFVRLVSENKVQLNIEEKYIDKYIEQYKNMPMKSLVDKIFSNKEMLKTFPNLKITNKDGNVVLIRDILSDINPYYLKVFTPKVIDKVKFAE